MARATGTRAAAIRRRTKHEQRINEHPHPLDRLTKTWAWVHAEARRHPHLLDQTIRRLHQLGADLNDLEANPGRETPK
ncbi:hypothetical protein [Actinoplanes sp. URMC 104]|uniref:hypothetical protein n=1 Tax=Actinoplanes sp. URMC 104 TaxID=3423409 RepID=UPI003F1CAAFF